MIESGDWPKLMTRLRQVANVEKDKGLTIVTVKLVLVGGELRIWSTPKVSTYEPRNSGAVILDALTE